MERKVTERVSVWVLLTLLLVAGFVLSRYYAVIMAISAGLLITLVLCLPQLVLKAGQRAALLKGNGLAALTLGTAFTVFLTMMWLGSGFALTRYHLMVMAVAAGLLVTSVVCLLWSGKVQRQAKDQAAALADAARRTERRVHAEQFETRRARQAEQLPLEEWDTVITNKPRPQPAAAPRPELLRPTPWRDLVPGRDPVAIAAGYPHLAGHSE